MKTGRFFAYNYNTGNDPYNNVNLYNVPRSLPLGNPELFRFGEQSSKFGNPNQNGDGLSNLEKLGIVAITLLVFQKIM